MVILSSYFGTNVPIYPSLTFVPPPVTSNRLTASETIDILRDEAKSPESLVRIDASPAGCIPPLHPEREMI